MPCYFNGIFGHKPSAGLVPNTGQYPIAVNQGSFLPHTPRARVDVDRSTGRRTPPALRYMCTGPMCKRADDLWPLLKIMAGPDGVDTYQQHLELGDPSQVDIKSLRVRTT
jgi:fatty acid amide hydrolase 2